MPRTYTSVPPASRTAWRMRRRFRRALSSMTTQVLGPRSALRKVSTRRGSPAEALMWASWSRRASVRFSTMNSTSNPGSRISSSIRMTSSSWQTARHRIATPTADYTLRFAPRVYSAVVCERVRAPSLRRTPGRGGGGGGLTAALVACVGVLTGSAQAPVFRTGVEVVNIGVTVTDSRGQLVTGLRAEDFEIYEDGRRQHLRYFAAGDAGSDAAPALHVGLLLDVSESMGDDLRFTQTA